jgi:uncharacterized membrane protein YbhN (UPF0104 family)
MEELPSEFQPKSLRRRALQALLAGAVLTGIILFAPGLGEVRDHLADASPAWLLVAALLEALSFFSYVIMFGPIFCTGLGWRRAWEIGGSELAMGSLVPASGAGGLALGAWVLYRGGMGGERIARRSVAFFLIKSGVNFLAVALIGFALAIGLVGPDLALWKTAVPAALAALSIVVIAALPRLGSGPRPFPGPDASRSQRWLSATRRAVVRGITEARGILRSRDRRVLAGSFGYWFFDNAVLWATFKAFGMSPPITVILMGYLIGQLGGLIPIPGGVGGIDLGLIGVLVAYGTPAAGTTAAVFAYHVILFWLPLVIGGVSFAQLLRNMPSRGEFASCKPAIAAQSAG